MDQAHMLFTAGQIVVWREPLPMTLVERLGPGPFFINNIHDITAFPWSPGYRSRHPNDERRVPLNPRHPQILGLINCETKEFAAYLSGVFFRPYA